MANGRYILVDESFQEKVLSEIQELKKLFTQKTFPPAKQLPELMDVPAVLDYLKITRRTLYTYRKKGLPTAKNELGKLLFWKEEVDKFFGNDN